MKKILKRIRCFFIGHDIKNCEWHEFESGYIYGDTEFSTVCKRCGNIIINTEEHFSFLQKVKDRNQTVVRYIYSD